MVGSRNEVEKEKAKTLQGTTSNREALEDTDGLTASGP